MLIRPDDNVELPEVVSRQPLLNDRNKININLCVVHKSSAVAKQQKPANDSRLEDYTGYQYRFSTRFHTNMFEIEI